MKNILFVLITLFISFYLKAQPNQLEYNYDVTYYKLNLEVTNNSTYISGDVTIQAEVVSTVLDTFVIELSDSLTVDSVFFEGNFLNFYHLNNEIIIPLGTSINEGANFTVKIYYNGYAPTIENIHGNYGGLINGMDLEFSKNVTWSNSEPFCAEYWWPCKQIISDKADSVDFFLTSDTSLTPASIGKLNNIVSLPNGKHRYEWSTRHPFPYYMIFFAVSEYEEFKFYAYPENSDSILVQCFFYDTACWNYYSDLMTYAKNGLEFLSELYGPYLFADEKYGYCAVPNYAHENLTITSMKPSFEEYHIYHCLGHQWFAGNVTCETYKDIWVHEGFGTYTEYLCFKEFLGEVYAQSWIQWDHSQIMSEPGGSVYVPSDEEWNADRIYNFRLSYWKGEQLLHMIRFELQNDSVFYQVLRGFNELYSGDVATGIDFKTVLENISGFDFTDFFDQWYFGEGFPIYDIFYYVQNDSLTFTSTQTTSTTTTELFKMHMEYKITGYNIDTTIRVYQSQNEQTYTIYFPDSIYAFYVDPYYWVINDVGDIIVGVTEIKRDYLNISVSPNPFTDKITIIGKGIELVELYNPIGQRIKIKSELSDKMTINLENKIKGCYLLRIITQEGITTKKVIKN